MQNSWRQQFGLEAICPRIVTDGVTNLPGDNYVEGDDKLWKGMVEADRHGQVRSSEVFPKTTYHLRICQETEEFGLEPGKLYKWSRRQSELDFNATEYSGQFRAAKCPRCLTPYKAYLDAMYWSLTTITTIGYGDRAPTGTGSEISFVLCAEFVGLAFFAILLTQINDVNSVIGESARQLSNQKNEVVQFLKYHDVDDRIITETVRFLNFRHSTLSGNTFSANDERFAVLSPGIRDMIKVEMNRPVLKAARIFGWNPQDIEEVDNVRLVFDSIDTLNNGRLTKPEIKQLFQLLQLKTTAEEFEVAFNELDVKNTGEIDFYEFKHWWYMKKHGRPIMDQCPLSFIDAMAKCMHTQAFDINEVVVPSGAYAASNGPNRPSFGIVLQGTVFVWKRATAAPPVFQMTEQVREEHDIASAGNFNVRQPQFVQDDDLFPIFGAKAVLTSAHRQIIEQHGINTRNWSVISSSYVDLAWINSQDMQTCFEQTWTAGEQEFLTYSFAHYCHGSGHDLHDLLQRHTYDGEPTSASSASAATTLATTDVGDHTAVMAAVAHTQRDVRELRTQLQSEMQRVMVEVRRMSLLLTCSVRLWMTKCTNTQVRKANELSQQVLTALETLNSRVAA